jgi:hypothetical protein
MARVPSVEKLRKHLTKLAIHADAAQTALDNFNTAMDVLQDEIKESERRHARVAKKREK